MDEDLRQGTRMQAAPTLIGLLRSGRLDSRRVAMAGYLGHVAARQTLAPWVPPTPLQDWSWPARHLLVYGNLTQRECGWLACVVSEHAIARGEADPSLLAPIQVVRAWCYGRVGIEQVEHANRSVRALSEAHLMVIAVLSIALHPDNFGGGAGSAAVSAVKVAGSESERDWQANAISETLLDPQALEFPDKVE